MPNHCTHVVKITGPDPVIENLVGFLAENKEPFSFNKILPQPSCVFRGNLGRKEEAQNSGRNWLDWNRRRWGTKWGAYDHAEPIKEKGSVVYRFDTAWSYPAPIFQELSALFPDLSIEVKAIDEGWNWAIVATYPGVGERGISCTWDNEEFADLYQDVYGEPIPEDEEDQ